MRLDQAIHDGQPQTRAVAFSGVERFEHLLELLLVQSRTTVGDLQHKASRSVEGRDDQLASFGHRVYRVKREVEHGTSQHF